MYDGTWVPTARAPETVVARAAPSSVLVLMRWCSLEVLLFNGGGTPRSAAVPSAEPRNRRWQGVAGKPL